MSRIMSADQTMRVRPSSSIWIGVLVRLAVLAIRSRITTLYFFGEIDDSNDGRRNDDTSDEP